jgi:hypothetical protein
MRKILVACIVMMLTIGAGNASADTGTIAVTSNSYAGTSGYANVGVSVTVTKTSCDWSSTYCGWFPSVTEVGANQQCSTAQPRYVGDIVDGLGTFTQDLGVSLLSDTATKLCLYIWSNGDRYINELVVPLNSAPPPPPAPPAPPAPPPPPPPPAPRPVSPMSTAEARVALPRVLRKEYRRRFNVRALTRSCFRLTSEKVRCRVSWRKNNNRYRGIVTMWNDPEDPANTYLYTWNIKRKRLARTPPRRRATPPPARTSCDPNYSGCLDRNASDYDCAGGTGDGPRYTGRVRVLGSDHFDLDRNGDGIGCEESTASAASLSEMEQHARAHADAERKAIRIGRGTLW